MLVRTDFPVLLHPKYLSTLFIQMECVICFISYLHWHWKHWEKMLQFQQHLNLWKTSALIQRAKVQLISWIFKFLQLFWDFYLLVLKRPKSQKILHRISSPPRHFFALCSTKNNHQVCIEPENRCEMEPGHFGNFGNRFNFLDALDG